LQVLSEPDKRNEYDTIHWRNVANLAFCFPDVDFKKPDEVFEEIFGVSTMEFFSSKMKRLQLN